MPLRLIDTQVSTDDYMRIRETSGLSMRYIALSYCWGRKSFLTTRRDNVEQHMQQIQLSNLPRTIQDAIICTRRLGLRYIWVDSLCIVQDDEIEKGREISHMKDIYRGAYLTLSASSSTSCHDGFLHIRRSFEKGFEFNTDISNTRGGHFTLIEVQQQPHPRMMLCPGAEPVSYRAWTTQESLLSNRLLIYGRLQLFWLCRQRFIPNGGNMTWQEFANHAAWLDLNEKDESDPDLGRQSHSGLDFDRYHSEWTSLVSVYSGRSLSLQEDKLAAISAIASVFQDKMQVEYICGLWKKSLLYDLTWAPAKHWIERPLTPETYVGPTWSWISYPELVQYTGRYEAQKEVARVISVSVTPRHSFAPLSQVVDATIVLEGPSIEMRPTKGFSSDWLLRLNVEDTEICSLAASFFPDYSHEAPMLIAKPLHCIILHGAQPQNPKDAGFASGLVLIESESNTFVRVGRFESYAHAWRNEPMLDHDGCTCKRRGPEARELRDRENTQDFLCSPRRVFTIV